MQRQRKHLFNLVYSPRQLPWLLLVLAIPLTVLANTIDKIVSIAGERYTGLEFRTSTRLLYRKVGDNSYAFDAALPAKAQRSYHFDDGSTVKLTISGEETTIKVEGVPAGEVELVPSQRGYFLRWKSQTKSEAKPTEKPAAKPAVEKNKAAPAKEPDPQSIDAQAAHFLNLIRSLQPKGNGTTLLDSGRLLLQQRRYPQAIKVLEQVSKEPGRPLEALMLLAQAYREKGEKKNFEKAWRDYVEAMRTEKPEHTSDSVVSLLNFYFPPLVTLPPLELPPDWKPFPFMEKMHEDSLAAAAEQHRQYSIRDAPPKPEIPEEVVQHHQPEPVKETPHHAETETKPASSEAAKSPVVSHSVSSENSLLPIAGSVAAAVVLTALVVSFWFKRRERKILGGLGNKPEAVVKQTERMQSASLPNVPSGLANVASTYAANSTLTETSTNPGRETVVGLDEAESSTEEAELESDSKRQMIYELEASGLSVREIAQKMGIGQDEVRTFLSLRKV